MEAAETPEEGIAREIAEETSLQVSALKLVGVYDFQRMNQVIIAYHAVASGTVKLSPELAEYKMFDLQDLVCWPACMAVNAFFAFKIGRGQFRPHVSSSTSNAIDILFPDHFKLAQGLRFVLRVQPTS